MGFIVGGARIGINKKPPQSSTAASSSGATIARQTTMTTVFTRFEDMGYFPFGLHAGEPTQGNGDQLASKVEITDYH